MATPALHPAALSFDIEDWFHPELVRDNVGTTEHRSVVRDGTIAILAALAKHGKLATFFVLGDVAAEDPDLVRTIAAAGHEIACHGMTHRPLWALDRDSFRAELRAFRAAIVAALGRDPVRGFRAPTFSLDRRTAWALEVLAEEGFEWDSSIFPMRVGLYGVHGAPRSIYRPSVSNPAREDPHGRLLEFPVTIGGPRISGLPVAGGFYLRVLPVSIVTATLDRVARRRPIALYLHPWECVPDLPRVRLSPLAAFVTYRGLASVPAKLDRLIARYPCDTMSRILERYGRPSPAA
ncbi:MAG TPA: polysaccharide deacetylase family protein [Candidatus Udaeobacter sp.]|nr:polysaccharide deacetylase family protein [Candidatus Udaeobacter sp.]